VQARLLHVVDAALPEAHPRKEGEDARICLVESLQGFHNAAINEKEVSTPGRQVLHAGEMPHQPVVETCRPDPARRFSFPRLPNRPDNLDAQPPFLQKKRDSLRWILHVCGHHDDTIATGMVQTTGQGQV